MFSKEQRQLLENVIESLNRLSDGVSTVADVHALLFATAAAVRGTSLCAAIEAPLPRLRELARSDGLPDRKRDVALELTDDLRRFIADRLCCDARDNPRQRHALSVWLRGEK